MANTVEKVVLAEDAVSIHTKRLPEPGLLPDGTMGWDVESKVLYPGETISLSELPPYLAEAVKKGEAPRLKLLTPSQAKRRAEVIQEALDMLGSARPPEVGATEEDPEFPAEEY